MRQVIWGIVATLWLTGLDAAAQEASTTPLRFYVSVIGNDAWSGRLAEPSSDGADGPFATLTRARDAVRALRSAGELPAGGVTVVVRGGAYSLTAPLELGPDDSGSTSSPITYMAAPGEEVRISGGRQVTNFGPVNEAPVLERLDAAARGAVIQADLTALGITDFGAPDGGGIEVFFQDKPMTLARWPNEGFVKIADIVVKDGHQIHGIEGSMTPKFVYEGDRPSRWVGEKDPWLHGYWFWDWSDQRQRIAFIDVAASTITLADPPHNYGYRKGQWYYAMNMLSELDAPGEWYVDRQLGLLFFWPPAPIESGSVTVSVIPNLVTLNGASFVTLSGFIFEAARGTAIAMVNGTDNRVTECVFRNLGADAVTVAGGERHGVTRCEMYNLGGGGITLSGGDRTTLTPAGHYAEDNHIHDYGRWYRMYRSAIALGGVGSRAAHNLLHDAPHIGILFSGNDHLIEFNELHNVCKESNDAGAMYAGRDWTMRGTVIRHNYLHHINGFEGRGCVGVYLDDMYCGTQIFGNVFYKVTRAAFIGGGRDCTVENNVFVDCNPAVHVDARALNWAAYHGDEWIEEARTKGTVSNIAYNKPPYSDKYPVLVNLMEDEPKAPKGNLIARNISVGGKWDEFEEAAKPYLTLQDNLIDTDPHFVDPEKLDFRLKASSPALTLGFKPIPVEQIGPRPR